MSDRKLEQGFDGSMSSWSSLNYIQYGYVFIINSAMCFKVDKDDMEPLKYAVSLGFHVAHFHS